MKNGIPCKNGALGTGHLLCVLYLFVGMVSLAACRSSRTSLEMGRSEEHAAVNEIVSVGTVGNTAAASEERADTAAVRADDNSVFTISRDSAGRITQVVASRFTRIVSSGRSRIDRDRWFYGLNATRCSEASAQVDSVVEKKTEAASAAEVRVPLMVRVGWCLVALVIIFYIADYIYRRWIEPGKR